MPFHNLERVLVTVLTGLIISCTWGQHQILKDYDWEAVPTLPDTNALEGDHNVILKRNMLANFEEDGDNMNFFRVFHWQRYLPDAAAVEGNQTIELGTDNVIEVLKIKARSISPDGVVHDLKDSDFRRRNDERDGSGELYFAFEGLQPGSMVEYLYFAKESSGYQGSILRFQFSIPVKEQRYELIVPDLWRYAFKGYNGVPVPETDSSSTGVLRYHFTLKDMPGLESERSAYAEVHRGYLAQKLDALPGRNILDISGYTSATRNYHKSMYPELSSKTKKELAACIKRMDLAFARDLDDRIRTMDDYIRRTFGVVNNNDVGLADLDQILRTKSCSEFGLTRLYANLFREAGIEHQLVLTTDRDEAPFDPTFEAHNFLGTMVIYFPEIKKFLEPLAVGLGLGYPDAVHMNTHGLFIRNVDVGGVFGGVGSIKPIPSLPAEATKNDLDIQVNFNDDVTEATFNVKNELTGYYANFTQNYFSLMNEEDRTTYLQEALDHLYEGAVSADFTAENTGIRTFGVKPFVLKGTAVTPMFTDQAGEDVLFRVGDLIGPQMEMYVEKPRKLPVDEDFNRYYDRQISITLPAGWSCVDLEPMTIHKTLEMDGKVMAEFRSSATQKDGVITVEAIEYYRTEHVPLEHFEAWRSVINAAADFNKRALLFTKKN